MKKPIMVLYMIVFVWAVLVLPSGAQTTSTEQPASPATATPQEAGKSESMQKQSQEAHEIQAEAMKAQREASEAMKEASQGLKQQSSQMKTEQQQSQQAQTQQGPVLAGDLPVRGPIRLSKLMKATVRNNFGEDLGTIEDVITDQNGKLDYVILSHGGILGIGEKLIPIPIQAVQPSDKEQTVMVNVAKNALEKAPSFDAKNWPNFSQPAWRQKTYTYYDVYGGSPLDKGLSESQ
jgi:sporulation protein YlmC with PRC-barrel domain